MLKIFAFSLSLYESLQLQYKRDKEELSSNLYSLLPESMETQFAKEMAQTHSEVGLCVCVCVYVCVCVCGALVWYTCMSNRFMFLSMTTFQHTVPTLKANPPIELIVDCRCGCC